MDSNSQHRRDQMNEIERQLKAVLRSLPYPLAATEVTGEIKAAMGEYVSLASAELKASPREERDASLVGLAERAGRATDLDAAYLVLEDIQELERQRCIALVRGDDAACASLEAAIRDAEALHRERAEQIRLDYASDAAFAAHVFSPLKNTAIAKNLLEFAKAEPTEQIAEMRALAGELAYEAPSKFVAPVVAVALREAGALAELSESAELRTRIRRASRTRYALAQVAALRARQKRSEGLLSRGEKKLYLERLEQIHFHASAREYALTDSLYREELFFQVERSVRAIPPKYSDEELAYAEQLLSMTPLMETLAQRFAALRELGYQPLHPSHDAELLHFNGTVQAGGGVFVLVSGDDGVPHGVDVTDRPRFMLPQGALVRPAVLLYGAPLQ